MLLQFPLPFAGGSSWILDTPSFSLCTPHSWISGAPSVVESSRLCQYRPASTDLTAQKLPSSSFSEYFIFPLQLSPIVYIDHSSPVFKSSRVPLAGPVL